MTDQDDAKGMHDIRELLQDLEDALLDNGWREMVIATDHGTFEWSKASYPHGVVFHHEDGTVTRYTEEEWHALRGRPKG